MHFLEEVYSGAAQPTRTPPPTANPGLFMNIPAKRWSCHAGVPTCHDSLWPANIIRSCWLVAKLMCALLFFLLALFVVAAPGLAAELPTDPAAIRAEMMKIRRSTNWNDPKAVQEANERVRQLTAQLEANRLKQEAVKAGASATEAVESAQTSVINRATVLDKVQQSAKENRGINLAFNNELRQQIVKEYEEERDPKITGKAFLETVTTLVINIETPEGQTALKQLDQFTSVRRLFISGGRAGAPINLEDVFIRAQKLPLEELQIYNFRMFVSSIPERIGQFKRLTKLALFNNGLRNLPVSISSLGSLTTLLVDVNPIVSVLPVTQRLSGLKELGIVQTKVPAEEIAQLRTILPQCKVMTE